MALQKRLDDDQKGMFFGVYYDNSFYWGKCIHMFSNNPESDVDEVDFSFMHPKHDGFWDWPKKKDEKRVSSKFVFFGPCMPKAPSRIGFKFQMRMLQRKPINIIKNISRK